MNLYLRDSQTEAGTTGTPSALGSICDLISTQGSAATLGSGATASSTFVSSKRFILNVGASVTGSSFPISIDMASVSAATCEWRVVIQRLNSSNAVQATSDVLGPFTTSGIKTGTLTLNTTWSAGDRLAVAFEHRKTGGGGSRSFTLNVNDADSSVDAPVTAPPVELGGSVSAVATAAGSMSVERGIAGSVSAVASASGDLTVTAPVVELAGGVSASASTQAGVSVTRGITGSIAATSSTAAEASVERGIAGAISATSATAGGASVTRGLTGSASASASSAAGVSVERGIYGSVAATSSVSGDLTVESAGQTELAGAISASTVSAGDVSVVRGLAGAISAQAVATASLQKTVSLSGLISAQATAVGSVDAGQGEDDATPALLLIPPTSSRLTATGVQTLLSVNCCGKLSLTLTGSRLTPVRQHSLLEVA